MRRIGIVVQRYGNEVSGGGEYHAMLLAERFKSNYDVEIITTASVDYMTWHNYYEVGTDLVNNIVVHRFRVDYPRRVDEMNNVTDKILPQIMAGQNVAEKEAYAWIDYQGPYCPELVDYLKESHDNYDVFIFITYLYYHTVYGLPEVADKALFIPTAHDEPWIRLGMFQMIFSLPRKIMYNTEEERSMVNHILHNDDIPSEIVGVGIDVPEDIDPIRFRKKFDIQGNYIVFVGRVDASKKCDEMIRYFISYKANHDNNLSLVLIGKTNMEIPQRPDIICTGFVSEHDKFDGLAGAKISIAPSEYESLCMALLEGMGVGVPVLANGNCAVLRGHCERSGAGIAYTNEIEFHHAVNMILQNEDQWKIMSMHASEYVKKNYVWTEIMRKFDVAIDEIICQPYKKKCISYGYRDLFETEKKKYILSLKKGEVIDQIDLGCSIVPVTFVSSDEYAPYMGVTICSILENASRNIYYDIVILVSDMNASSAEHIYDICCRYSNCSVRFYNINELVSQYTFYKESGYEDYTYYRLLIPNLMRNYKKVIYLDCDVVINADISELYSVDLEDNCIAACRDPLILSVQSEAENDNPIQRHLKKWDLMEVGTYFQGGVQLINPSKINNMCSAQELFKMASENQFVFCDQDILNIVCKGKIKYLSSSWNVLSMSKELANICDYWMPSRYYDEYIEARKNPKIIHYADKQMPWKTWDADFSNYYWKYAKKTPFYEMLLFRGSRYFTENEFEKRNKINESKIMISSEKLLFRTKVKRKFVMPIVNMIFPCGSRSRERVKTMYCKFREKVVWH